MPLIANLMRVSCGTTGTGTLTLGGAITGFLNATQAGLIDGLEYSYGIEADFITVGDDSVATSREVGRGTYTASGGTLTRNVRNSTNGDALLNLAGDAQVIICVTTQNFKELLTTGRSYYVRTDGSDSNNGLSNTSGGAWLTIQHALDTITGALDFGGQIVFVNIGAGTYTQGANIPAWVGGGQLIIQGDTTTPSNVFLNVSSPTTPFGGIFEFNVPIQGLIIIKGFKFTTTSSGRAHINLRSNGIYVQIGKNEYAGVTAGTFTAAISCSNPGCYMQLNDNFTISASMPSWLSINAQSYLEAFTLTATISGTPNFDWQGVFMSKGGIAYLQPITFSGSATGVRYFASQNGIIDTGGGGASFLPGNSAGSTGTQGQYL